jgi:hypothetical protein
VCNKNWSVVLLNKKIHILLSQVYCVRQVVTTPTITSNNVVFWSEILSLHSVNVKFTVVWDVTAFGLVAVL